MIRDNYSITKLFMNKDITLFIDDKSFIVRTHSIREFFNNNELNGIYNLIIKDVENLQQLIIYPIKTQLDAIKAILFDLGRYKKYALMSNKIREVLPLFLPELEINMSQHFLSVNGVTITDEIWEYVIYILKLSCGEKVNQPLNFDSEEARKFYMAQKATEKRIASLKQKDSGGDDNLMKNLLSITYAFPSMTIDYLCDQTMAQIHWLQKYAAGAMSYEVSAKAFAAGNMKKGSKLDFFIK